MMNINDFRPKKSLGQNFLKDPRYIGKIAAAAKVCPDDHVIEIGPGLGHLTRALISRAKKVLAIELDERLVAVLKREFAGVDNLKIEHADALAYPYDKLPGKWKVVANLPYYISTPIIRRLIESRKKFASLTLMLQKETAERIAATPGGKEYGFLSVLVQLYAEPNIEFIVPAGAFTPRPEVDSAVITLMPKDKPAVRFEDEDRLLRVVKAAFSQRRKTLRNALKQLGATKEKMDSVQSATGIDLNRRAETLSIEEFAALAEFL